MEKTAIKIRIKTLKLNSVASPIEFIGKTIDRKRVFIHSRSNFSISLDNRIIIQTEMRNGRLDEEDDVIEMQRLCEKHNIVIPERLNLLRVYRLSLR